MIRKLPSCAEMYRALQNRDSGYEGVFFTAVKTTGVFCRPTCPAKKPRRENVRFFAAARDALAAGYRPCKRCRPLDAMGATPDWLDRALQLVEQDPGERWTDSRLRQQGIDPVRVRSWFKRHHGMTFHAYQRSRRLAMAMQQISVDGETTVAALDHGFQSTSGFRQAFRQLFGDTPSAAASNGRHAVFVNRILTPLGPMIAVADDRGLHLFDFVDRRMLERQLQTVRGWIEQPMVPGNHPVLTQLDVQMGEYFAGVRRSFSVPLVLRGTEFQLSVWRELQQIGFGCTCSYQQLAERLGRPRSVRAVGRANGDNRFAIIIPCHRVVASDGTLCGYGGGLWRKQRLLEHERKTFDSTVTFDKQ